MNSLCIALLCGASGCALALQFPAAAAAGTKEKVLHSFASGTDGASPETSLINVKGTLYGTTYGGGGRNGGVIFSLDPDTVAEQVLHSFGDGSDGLNPQASLIDVKGTLYGTTSSGGGLGSGAVFALDLSTGVENTVYGFCGQQGCTDGATPYAGLIQVNGKLYGTTVSGGAYRRGTVFSFKLKTGAERALHSFGGGTDGESPYAVLINVNGTLYGTTSYGGSYGQGTVFSVDPNTGAETVLHSFGSGTDGATPYASLIDVNGALYGTTWIGGAYSNGTVFSFDPNTGAETIVHSFGSGTDGTHPHASPIDVKGTLYGTTSYGGTVGQGTAFSIDPTTGAETIVHSFGISPDGANPYASLIDVNGTLYGTTESGGAYGHGTVFEIKRP